MWCGVQASKKVTKREKKKLHQRAGVKGGSPKGPSLIVNDDVSK